MINTKIRDIAIESMRHKLLEKIHNRHQKINLPHVVVYTNNVKSLMNESHCVPFTYTTPLSVLSNLSFLIELRLA